MKFKFGFINPKRGFRRLPRFTDLARTIAPAQPPAFIGSSGSLCFMMATVNRPIEQPKFTSFSRRLVLLFVGALGAACAPASRVPPATAAGALPAAQVKSDRLPGDVQPLSYSLELTVLPKTERFSGRAQILVQVKAPTAVVLLHAKSLQISGVRGIAGQTTIAGSFEQLNEDGVSALRFQQPLPAGEVVLEITYDAPFDRQLRGHYRVDSGGESYAFTQFEPISARSAFPCFDEPNWKTPYELWLTVPNDDVAVSNTLPVAEEAAGEGIKRIHFAQTKPLPSYLVAWAVGPLDIVNGTPIAASAVRPEPVPVRGIAAKGKGAQLSIALSEVGPQLTALERYFGIAYPYGKLDIVAVPDFAAGAMENAGLVTFRDFLLLLDPKTATEGQRRANAGVMAHEFAHQWFGDLVTMYYWDDIWLNEAFATWMGNRITNELHPQYKSDSQLLMGIEDAMGVDARVTARMIRQPITSSHDIVNAFDSITYSKGGGVLGMFERYLTPDVFRKGVQQYLQAHADKNASTDDLLDALSAAAGKDVKTPFNTFLTQVGVPLVEAEVACAGGTAELRLKQSRYLPLGSTGSKDERWQIPVCARYEIASGVKEACLLLSEPTGVIGFEKGQCPAWVMPNANAAGYYRFSLPAVDLEKLRTKGYKRLTARERYALVTGMIASVDTGSLSAKDLLRMLPTFAADLERSVAGVPADYLSWVHEKLAAESDLPALAAYVNKMYLPVRARLGFREQTGETGDAKLLRAQVLGALAEVGREQSTRDKLVKWGRDYLGATTGGAIKPEAVPKDIADVAVNVAVEQGDDALFDAVYQQFLKTEDASVRLRLLIALGSVRDARSQKALALSLDPKLRVNEIVIPLRAQFGDRRTKEAAREFLEHNFDKLSERLSASAAGSLVWLSTAFCDDASAARAEAFFGSRVQSLAGGPRILASATEQQHLCASVVSAQRPSLEEFFGKKPAAPPAAAAAPAATNAAPAPVPPPAAPSPTPAPATTSAAAPPKAVPAPAPAAPAPAPAPAKPSAMSASAAAPAKPSAMPAPAAPPAPAPPH
jgi:alanyl aminopeptidase